MIFALFLQQHTTYRCGSTSGSGEDSTDHVSFRTREDVPFLAWRDLSDKLNHFNETIKYIKELYDDGNDVVVHVSSKVAFDVNTASLLEHRREQL